MDTAVIWSAVGAAGTVAAAGIAAWAAAQSRSSAQQANKAATTLAAIERDRRHSELMPRFRVVIDSWGDEGGKQLRITLIGPPSLPRLDHLTLRIRNNPGRRSYSAADHGWTDEPEDQIWGPFMFAASPASRARVSEDGRMAWWPTSLPHGEELPFMLNPAPPPLPTMTPEQWREQQGDAVRLIIDGGVRLGEWSWWGFPCEVVLAHGNHGEAIVP